MQKQDTATHIPNTEVKNWKSLQSSQHGLSSKCCDVWKQLWDQLSLDILKKDRPDPTQE